MGIIGKITGFAVGSVSAGPRGGKFYINAHGNKEYGTPPKARGVRERVAPKASAPKKAPKAPTQKAPPQTTAPKESLLGKPSASKPPTSPAASIGLKPGQEDHGTHAQSRIPIHRDGLTSHTHRSAILGRVETDYAKAAHHIESAEEAVKLMGVGKLLHNRDLPVVLRFMETNHDEGAHGRQSSQPDDPRGKTVSSEVRIYVKDVEHAALRRMTEGRAPSGLASNEYTVPPAGGHSPHHYVHATVIHELGHWLNDYGLDRVGPIRDATVALRAISKARNIALIGNIQGQRPHDETPNQDKILAVSKYAKTNVAEFVAEAHTAYVLHGSEMQKLDPETHAAVKRVREELGIE